MKNQIELARKSAFTSLFMSTALCLFAFYKGAQLTLDDPMKQNYVLVIALAEVVFIISCITLLTNKEK